MKKHSFKNSFRKVMIFTCVLVGMNSFAQNENFISAANPAIQYVGRIDFTKPASPVFSYPGTSIKARFTGTFVKVILKDLTPSKSDYKQYYAVLIDGVYTKTIEVNGFDTLFVAATGLSAGSHDVEIFKRTESLEQNNSFNGFIIDGTLGVLPSKPSRKIEFIGDSWTCGFGNELSNSTPKNGFSPQNEDNYNAWGAIISRKLHAQYMAVAVSGRGLYRNNTASLEATLPLIYDRVNPHENVPKWNFETYIPDAIVIKLGTNDFFPETWASPNMLDSSLFVNTYLNFVKTIRSKNSTAQIVIVCGSSLSDWWPENFKRMTRWRNYTKAILSIRKSLGDTKITMFELSTQNAPYGEDWHPTKATHVDMANQLIPHLKNVCNWNDEIIEGSINDPKIVFEGVQNTIVNKDSVIFNMHSPDSYKEASSGIVYYPCNLTRNNQSGVRIRFKTDSPEIKLEFVKRKDGYFAITTPTDGFVVNVDGAVLKSFSSPIFTIQSPKVGEIIEYEIVLPNLWAVILKKFQLNAGYKLQTVSANTKPTYAAFGTSITQGTGQYVNSTKTYPYKIAKEKNWNLHNFGVAGSVVGWQLAYDVKGKKMDYITVEQGFNDWATDYAQPLVTVSGIYARFIDSLRSFQPSAHIYCIAPIVSTFNATKALYTLNEFRMEVKRLVDVRRAAGDIKIHFINGGDISNSSMLSDGIHLNESGADQLAKALVPLLSDLTILNEVEDNQLSIFPNPCADFVVLKGNKNYSWVFKNNQGEIIKEGVDNLIDISNSPSGLYFIHIENKVFKVVKK